MEVYTPAHNVVTSQFGPWVLPRFASSAVKRSWRGMCPSSVPLLMSEIQQLPRAQNPPVFDPLTAHREGPHMTGLCFGNALLCSLPEIFCLWAGEPHDVACHNIKHLAGRIRRGNWASSWKRPLACNGEDAAGKLDVSVDPSQTVPEWAAARLESGLLP